jgi:hypothetical protein
LKEQFETGQKDLEQLKNQYSKKLEKQNKIIEKYQRVAKNSVKRYIESQAVRLGVKSDEIINRLPKNYSFNDIDMICEDLQEYKFNMSNLPFGQYGLNEDPDERVFHVIPGQRQNLGASPLCPSGHDRCFSLPPSTTDLSDTPKNKTTWKTTTRKHVVSSLTTVIVSVATPY